MYTQVQFTQAKLNFQKLRLRHNLVEKLDHRKKPIHTDKEKRYKLNISTQRYRKAYTLNWILDFGLGIALLRSCTYFFVRQE
ncbi:hypothetical protein CEN40_15975, partial [Fischerella thermalis CCMEE 5205]